MEERFKELYKYIPDDTQYDKDITINSAVLLHDNKGDKNLILLKLANMSDKTVLKVDVQIQIDKENIAFSYDGSFEPDEIFGQKTPIYIENLRQHKFTASVTNIDFSPETKRDDEIILGNSAIDIVNTWICAECGKENPNSNLFCGHCGEKRPELDSYAKDTIAKLESVIEKLKANNKVLVENISELKIENKTLSNNNIQLENRIKKLNGEVEELNNEIVKIKSNTRSFCRYCGKKLD